MSVPGWVFVAIPAGSLVVGVLALWRSGRRRVLDLRTGVRKDAAELRLSLELLSKAIPAAVHSRLCVSAATGSS